MNALHRKPHAQILLVPWRERYNQNAWWGLGLLLLTAFLPSLAMWAWQSAEQAGLMLLVTVAALLQLLWAWQFSSLLRQNHPHAARLVPGHPRRLREVAVGLWLLLSLACALPLGAMVGHTLAWGLGAAALMLLMAVALSSPLFWWVIAFLSMAPAWWPRSERWLALREQAVAVYQQRPLLLAVVVLALLAWLLCLQLQGGDDRHRSAYARREMARQAMCEAATGRSTLRYQGRLGLWLAHCFGWPFRAWMGHLIAAARPEASSVLARAELSLGARSHWTAQAVAGVILVGGIALIFALLVTLTGTRLQDILTHAKYGLTIGLTCSAVGPAISWGNALYFSRREQALIMLLPGMPRGAELNRRLARRRLWQALLGWLAVVVLVSTLVLQGDVNDPLLAFVLAGMPTGLLLLRNWAAMRQPSAKRIVLPMLLMVLIGLAGYAALRWLALPTGLLLAALLALTLLIGAWRWRRLAGYPQALPVGRLA